MAYTAVPTVNTGDTWTAANHNTYIRDNFAAGVPDIFTTAGDIAYATAADVAARLAIGSAGQLLKTNPGATAPFWDDPIYIVEVEVFAHDVAVATGNGQAQWIVPSSINGYDLTGIEAGVHTASSSGVVTVQIHNLTDTVDKLSTAITVDANEYSSNTAATPPVIDTDNDDVVTDDRIRIDVDGAGTGTKGLKVTFTWEKP